MLQDVVAQLLTILHLVSEFIFDQINDIGPCCYQEQGTEQNVINP